MAPNILGHHIMYDRLAARGALGGFISALVMLVIAVVSPALYSQPDVDGWSFLKAVSTLVLGDGAASPLFGFEAVPVFVGLALHLLIGVLAGAVLALLVGLLDIDGPIPVLMSGMLFGLVVFLGSYTAISLFSLTAFETLPIGTTFLSHVVFGMVTGLFLLSWSGHYDLDEPNPNAWKRRF